MATTSIKQVYSFAVIATDVVIFTVREGELQVLLIQMKKAPYVGRWAIPGGLVKPKESVDAAARRHLAEKTGVSDVYLEQLYTFGRVDRDPYGRVVSVAYFALIPSDNVRLKTTARYGDVRWFPAKGLPKLAYDHREMLTVAVDRLRSKLEYSNIVYSLLPREFTLAELQRTYEIILGRGLDKRNFRKKLFSLNLVQKVNKRQSGVAYRPAELYRFVSRTVQVVSVL